MSVLIGVILPVLLVVATAALAQPYLRLDLRTLSRAAFYLFSPALVFDALSNSPLGGGELAQVAAAMVVPALLLWLLATLTARLLRLEGPLQSAFLLTIVLMNAGNYGIPVTLFAFGEEGVARATLYFTFSSMAAATLGVFIASRGRTSTLAALRRLAGIPLVYAALLGLIVNLAGLNVPEPLAKSVHLLGQASVPVMLAMLGIQLRQVLTERQRALHLPALTVAAVARLLVSPALTALVAWAVGLRGVAHSAMVIEGAMPTAVMTTVLATEFDAEPGFASMGVFVTTLVSLLSLTILLNWMS